MRVAYLVTDPMTTRFVEGQLSYLREQGHDITLITSPGERLWRVAEQEGVDAAAVPMRREIAPAADLVALVRLIALLRRLDPAIVHAGTPKAGLLGMLAAWLLRVPVRLYQLRGLPLATATGLLRGPLWLAERTAAACATTVTANSDGLAADYVARGLAPADKVIVPACGSSNGVDAARFTPSPARREAAKEFRVRYGIPGDAPVVGFVGRLTRDKGVADLATAFVRVRQKCPRAHLLIVGDFESGDPVPERVKHDLRADPAVTITGFVPDVAPFYHVMGVLALPSYREGFPNAPLEAAAAEVPTVAYAAVGTVDAVVDGETGRLVPVGDIAALAKALLTALRDDDLRRRWGSRARERAETDFDPDRVWIATASIYAEATQPPRPA